MEDVTPRRRMVARSGFAASLLALPMTASICYASATAAPPEPAAPPAVAMSYPLAPPAPEAPEAPEPPAAPDAPEAAEIEREMIEIEREFDRADRELARAEREIERELGKGRVVRERMIVRRDGKQVELTDEEREELRRELKESMAELREQFAEDGELRREIRMSIAEARAGAAEARAEALASAPRVVVKCRDEVNVVSTEVDAKGRTTMFVCEANADKMALKSLKLARKTIAKDRNLSDSERAEALRGIDEEIARLSR